MDPDNFERIHESTKKALAPTSEIGYYYSVVDSDNFEKIRIRLLVEIRILLYVLSMYVRKFFLFHADISGQLYHYGTSAGSFYHNLILTSIMFIRVKAGLFPFTFN